MVSTLDGRPGRVSPLAAQDSTLLLTRLVLQLLPRPGHASHVTPVSWRADAWELWSSLPRHPTAQATSTTGGTHTHNLWVRAALTRCLRNPQRDLQLTLPWQLA